jgi:hypothetical protein
MPRRSPPLSSDPREAEWQSEVIRLATIGGWRHHHQFNARRSGKGWPDLTLVRPPELVIAELKTERGRVSDEQKGWLADLAACGVEVYVWRPSDLEQVSARLVTSPRAAWSPNADDRKQGSTSPQGRRP